jgi:hypothetical protein
MAGCSPLADVLRLVLGMDVLRRSGPELWPRVTPQNEEDDLTRTDKGASRRKAREPESDDKTLHLRLTPDDQQRLRAILGHMLTAPEAVPESVSYAGALRYAMRRCVENLHTKAARGS